MDHDHDHDHGTMPAPSVGMNMTMSTMNHDGHRTTTMDHDHGGGHSMDMGMKMYFHTGEVETILFEPLKTNSVGTIFGACVVLFFLAMLYEGIKYFREYLLRQAMQKSSGNYTPSVSASSTDQMMVRIKEPGIKVQMLSGSHIIQTFLHMVQVFISYCLMLVFMTYNVWLCIAIILGAGLGYFFFGWRRAVVVDINEHCH